MREILQAVGVLRWRLGRPVESFLIGAYRSVWRGEGIEFADARPYQLGEPWRRIHWSLSARRGQPYLWLGMEERQLTCCIALDLSASMALYPQKRWQAALAGAMLALTALKAGDKVQWLGFTDRVEFVAPPRRAPGFVWGAFQDLLQKKPEHLHTRLAPLLKFYGQVHSRRSFLVLLTDGFWQDGPEALRFLQAAASRHFVLVLYVRHPRETLTLPFGHLPYREVETGAAGALTGSLRPPLLVQPSLRQAVLHSDSAILPVLVRALGGALL